MPADFYLPETYYDPPDYDEDKPVVKDIGKRTAKAKKEYTCDECNGKIKPGTTYTRICLSVDGVIHTGRHHGTYCHPYANED